MSEKAEELAITLSSSPNLSHQNPENLTPTVSFVEELLAKSNSPNEALDWARVREVILRQNEEVKEKKHGRFLETTRLIYGLAFAGISFLVGIVLWICYYDNAVYLILAGLIPVLSLKKPN
jgi:hypothetical protein